MEWPNSDHEKRILNDIHDTWEGQPDFIDFSDVLFSSGEILNDGIWR